MRKQAHDDAGKHCHVESHMQTTNTSHPTPTQKLCVYIRGSRVIPKVISTLNVGDNRSVRI